MEKNWKDKETEIKENIISSILEKLIEESPISTDAELVYEGEYYTETLYAKSIYSCGGLLTIGTTNGNELSGEDVFHLTISSLIELYEDVKNADLYLTITAHIADEPCDDNSMVLYCRAINASERSEFLNKESPTPFLEYLFKKFPLFKWMHDDGEDTFYTTYAQYVSYTEGKVGGNYVLATIEYLPHSK